MQETLQAALEAKGLDATAAKVVADDFVLAANKNAEECAEHLGSDVEGIRSSLLTALVTAVENSQPPRPEQGDSRDYHPRDILRTALQGAVNKLFAKTKQPYTKDAIEQNLVKFERPSSKGKRVIRKGSTMS